jgi:hypothetical protein
MAVVVTVVMVMAVPVIVRVSVGVDDRTHFILRVCFVATCRELL